MDDFFNHLVDWTVKAAMVFGVAAMFMPQQGPTEDEKKEEKMKAYKNTPCYKEVVDLPNMSPEQRISVLQILKMSKALSVECVSMSVQEGMVMKGVCGEAGTVQITVPADGDKVEFRKY